jgi:aminopeptidase N
LLVNTAHPHPKVRTAIARALGNYRDESAATALLAMRDDASYFAVAAAYESLGKTRDPRAFDALTAGVRIASWSDTIGAGAARGLGALADARALAPLMAALDVRQGEALRRAAVVAIAELGSRVDSVRGDAVDVLERTLGDASYLVRVSTYTASEKIGDARLLAALDRSSTLESDGRLRRDAAEAAIRVRETQKVPMQVEAMREELEKLRVESRTLRERLDELTQK